MPNVLFADLVGSVSAARTETIFSRSGTLSVRGAVIPTGGLNCELSLYLRNGVHQMHPLLGRVTPIWGYTTNASADGLWPGPVVEVESGSRVRLKYHNQLAGTISGLYQHVVADPRDPIMPMNEVGSATYSATASTIAPADERVGGLRPWTVPHLHGAPTVADSDGWAENVSGADERQPREYQYDFPRETYTLLDPRPGQPDHRRSVSGGASPLYWYHDHAMSVTRFNVFAGLAGAWIVRDAMLERSLNLPVGERELTLVLQDRNLETADGTPGGTLTGRILHKVQSDVMEFFGPVNVVNGQMWPNVPVERGVWRLRFVNGANARTFDLRFMTRSGVQGVWSEVDQRFVQLIGTDGGLLGQSVPVTGLIMSPGERVDVLIDFSEIAKTGVSSVTVFNVAPAPWGGKPSATSIDKILSDGAPVDLLTIPEVMRFNIDTEKATTSLGSGATPIDTMPLDNDFVRIRDHGQLPHGHQHQFIVLREDEVLALDEQGNAIPDPAKPGSVMTMPMLRLHEMMEESMADQMGMNMYKARERGPVTLPPAAPGGAGIVVDSDPSHPLATGVPSGIRVVLPDPADATKSIAYVTAAKGFMDKVNVVIPKDAWAIWKVLNLSPDTHPFHIHLVQFQAMEVLSLKTSKPIDPASTEFEFLNTSDPPTTAFVSPIERGWKDTLRIDPNRDGQDQIANGSLYMIAAQHTGHAGRYMYHCHILEHEDQEMMRPYVVMPADLLNFGGMNMGGQHVHGAVPTATTANLAKMGAVAGSGKKAASKRRPNK